MKKIFGKLIDMIQKPTFLIGVAFLLGAPFCAHKIPVFKSMPVRVATIGCYIGTILIAIASYKTGEQRKKMQKQQAKTQEQGKGETFTLQLNKDVIQDQFMSLKEYYDEIGTIIKKRIKEKEKLQQSVSSTPEMQEQYSDRYADDFFLAKMVEHTFCNSIIISIYTLIEKYLNEICRSLRVYKGLSLVCEDINGTGVIRAKKYLEKLCKITFDTKDTNFLFGINAVRNIIAHNNGELSKASTRQIGQITKISQQAPGCKIIPYDFYDADKQPWEKIDQKIELELDFVDYCFEQENIVFKNIFKQTPAIPT
ncbi:hypothetical protein [Treponema endosymbiont of Eucomonympha sp.]|uniref:hypothetical protein n=1 Tax=Treponema endosymbiont of Eucomonympha sp. TaxID=1580831 RepID=UPI000750E270|nr:hypothetical protein [Treponema endosymbiont of Eucomonympha sp.]